MRAVVQRVSRASVTVEGRVTGSIGRGLLVLVGFAPDDVPDRDLAAVGGAVLVVSQFTLYGDASKGRRPSFIGAASPDVAIPLYEAFIAALRGRGIPVETGEFGAMMDVELVNDGPVTLILER